jgi:hypothetical protein
MYCVMRRLYCGNLELAGARANYGLALFMVFGSEARAQ